MAWNNCPYEFILRFFNRFAVLLRGHEIVYTVQFGNDFVYRFSKKSVLFHYEVSITIYIYSNLAWLNK